MLECRLVDRKLVVRPVWPGRPTALALSATVLVGAVLAMAPGFARAGVFSFTRTDYLLEAYSVGLGSVAVGDLDGKNGPDIVADGYTGLGFGPNKVNVLLNNGDGTFAPAVSFETCDGASSIVVGQFNPSTDGHIDVAMICGSQRIGRMLGDGQGNLGTVQSIDVSYLSGSSPAALIDFLRVGAMNGPTLVYAGYIAGIGETVCFLTVPHLEYDLDHGATDLLPECNVHYNDIVGNPNFGQIDDFGPVRSDLAVGAIVPNPDDPLNRDEALSGGNDPSQIPFAVTGYTPFYASTWSYSSRASSIPGLDAAVAIADLDGDHQNDLLLGGGATIADYVPGFPIEQGATPTHTFASIATLYDLVTADFDGDGKVDIAAVGEDDYEDDGITVAIQRGNGDGTFAPYERFPARGYDSSQGRQVIAVGDFDRNGSPDLVTVGEVDRYASVLLNGVAPSTPCGNGTVDAGEQCDDSNTIGGDCCSATCQFESVASTCAPPALLCSCNATGQCQTAGALACPYATKTIGSAGGSLALPDGSVTVTVPVGAVAVPTGFAITGLTASAFGVGTNLSLVKVADLAPAGVGFLVPVELRLLWPDTAPADGVVDGLGVDEATLKLYKNGIAITGQCSGVAYQPATCSAACCDAVANAWTVKVSSFSEYVLDAASCAVFEKPKLTLAKILAPAGDDTLAFTGALAAAATQPDPDLHGLAIALQDANGPIVTQTLPVGVYDKATKTGWKVDKKRTKWSWTHPKDGTLGGFAKAVVVLKKGRLTMALKGLNGGFAATAPVALEVTFPANGECMRTDFSAPTQACTIKSKGKKLVCK